MCRARRNNQEVHDVETFQSCEPTEAESMAISGVGRFEQDYELKVNACRKERTRVPGPLTVDILLDSKPLTMELDTSTLHWGGRVLNYCSYI